VQLGSAIASKYTMRPADQRAVSNFTSLVWSDNVVVDSALPCGSETIDGHGTDWR